MQVLVFDIRGQMAHFRMPDTTNTHASYPFIPPTTVRGLAASMLGLPDSLSGVPDFTGTALVGIRIMKPVKSTMQQMSMLGKGWLVSGGDSFNRPTAIELLINPHYRIYWTGAYFEELEQYLRERKSYYHTYLGSAFALTFPQYIGTFPCEPVDAQQEIECSSIVPVDSIKHLITAPGNQYSRIGGVHYEYLGDRNFGRTCSVLYEPSGHSISLEANTELTGMEAKFCKLKSGETVCLW